MPALVTISFTVPAGYAPGDYARLHGNGGAGEIDWDTPLTGEIFDLYPDGAGLYGYGTAPYGHHPYGHGHALRAPGYGHLPYGHHPYGHGSAVIETQETIVSCGTYRFGFKLFDDARDPPDFADGNPHAGTPAEAEVIIHIAPPAPRGLKLVSYNKTADILILAVA